MPQLLNFILVFRFAIRFFKGRVAEWLGTALQKLVQRFESALDLKVKNINFNKLTSWQLLD